MTIAKRFVGTSIAPVATQSSAVALPGSLVIAPGVYTFDGKNYDCTVEGLYRFFVPMVNTQQRIVWQSNVDALMSSIAWIAVNGRSDEALALPAKTTQAMTSKLRMLCSATVDWAKYLTDSGIIGLQTRIVRCLTAHTPGNYYDGHVMLEVKVGSNWVLYDLANGMKYQAPGGSRALKDVLPLTAAITKEPISDNAYAIEAAPSAGTLDVTAWQELTMREPAEFNSELERVLQIPGIVHTDNLTYFYLPTGMESRQSWVLGLNVNYRVISQSAWLSMFYP